MYRLVLAWVPVCNRPAGVNSRLAMEVNWRCQAYTLERVKDWAAYTALRSGRAVDTGNILHLSCRRRGIVEVYDIYWSNDR